MQPPRQEAKDPSASLKIVHSCPTKHRIPPRAPRAPRAPTQRPRVPSRQPPSFMLPPSPPVFDPLEVLEEYRSEKSQLARSLSSYSASSYPGYGMYPRNYSPGSFRSKVSTVSSQNDTKSPSPSPTIFSIMRVVTCQPSPALREARGGVRARGSPRNGSGATGSANEISSTPSMQRESVDELSNLQFDLTLDTTGEKEGKTSPGASLHPSLT
ncbi:hypothetical protein AAMO2058_000736900 [Amorphochlora amoebiformis]